MRQIGTFSDPEQASAFADYLLTVGIASKLDQSAGGAALWIRDEDQLAEARTALAEFQANPRDEKYLAAARQADQVRRDALERDLEYRRNMIDMRRRWNAGGSAGQRPLTLAIIAAAILVTLASNFGKLASPATQALLIEQITRGRGDELYLPVKPLVAVQHGEVWRLITPILLHGSVIHLLFNMMMFYDLGGQIEAKRGWRLLLALVLATAIPSNVGQLFWSGPLFMGMSGVVYGLFGYIWMQSRFVPGSGLYVSPNGVFILIFWFILCAMGFIGSVANAAHAYGLGVGMALGYAPVLLKGMRR